MPGDMPAGAADAALLGPVLLKLLGALFIVAGCGAAGWQAAGNLARRPQELRAAQVALSILETEIGFGASPLPSALRRAASAVEGRIGSLLAGAALRLERGEGVTPGDALGRSLREAEPETALRPADTEILLALGAVLGASDRRDQARHLTLARERLAAAEERAAAERVRYERVCKYMGVLAGCVLALLML
jgi:stage III sporulation protein AB